VKFVILGSTELYVGQRKVDLGAAKQRGLLGLLLYQVRKPVPTDLVIAELWPGKRHEAIRNSLYQLVSRIRTTLRRSGVPGTLTTASDYYRLDLNPDLVDFHVFTRWVQESDHATKVGDHRAAAGLLTEAIALWRGTPLADLDGNWSSQRRDHMTHIMWLGAYKRLFDALLTLGEHQTVLEMLGPLRQDYDLDEMFARQWMIALDGTGRSAEATQYFLDFWRRWVGAMGFEPSQDLQDTHTQIIERRHQSDAGRALVPHRLRDIHDFTGHQELLAELDSILADPCSPGGVVVIDGMPGIGKTTLARHWANHHRELFPEGQQELDLRAYGPVPPIGPYEALGKLLNALGVQSDAIPTSEDQRRQRLDQLLSGRRMLILLDNAYDTQQVRRLLPTSGDTAILITSRNRLQGLTVRDGIHSITVPPLNRDESASLLKQMIGDHRAGRERDALIALAELTGGLPLALRLIGRRVAERPRAQLPDVVEQLRRQPLTPGHGIDDEDAGVRAAFSYSYRSLPAEAAEMFRLLSLDPGANISVGAAAALSDSDNFSAERLLEHLARVHLLEHDVVDRYRFHDLLRSFAGECAQREETTERRRQAVRRMLDWYLLSATNAAVRLAPQRPKVPDLPNPERAEPATFDDDAAAKRWCEEERANLTAATRCAAEYGFHNHAWQIPGAVHEFFERYGDQDDVLECNEIAVNSARIASHTEGLVGSLNHLALATYGFRDYDRAMALFDEAIRLAGILGDRRAQGTIMHNVGNIHIKRGDFRTAITLYERSLQTSRDLGDLAGVAHDLHRLGKAYRHMAQHRESLCHHREALTIREQIGHLRGQGASHAELAALYMDLGDHATALKHAERALKLASETMDQSITCDALITRAVVHKQQKRLAAAVSDARTVVDLCEAVGDSGRSARALHVLIQALTAAGQHDQAELAREALRNLDRPGPPLES